MADYNLTDAYEQFIIEHEAYGPGQQRGRDGTDHVAYQDSGGKWTIGYGHTTDVKEGDRLTDEQARELIPQDVAIAAETARSRVKTWDTLNPNQQAGVVDAFFNVRLDSLEKSDALKLLNQGDWEGWQREANGENGFNKVTLEDGTKKFEPGLVKRTKARAALGDTPYEEQKEEQKETPIEPPAETANVDAALAPPLTETANVDDSVDPTIEAAAAPSLEIPEPVKPRFAAPEPTPLPAREEAVLEPTIRQQNEGIEGQLPNERYAPPGPTALVQHDAPVPELTTRQLNEAEATRREKYEADSENGFLNLVSGAFQNENMTFRLDQMMSANEYFPDINFNIEEAMKTQNDRIEKLDVGADSEELGAVLGSAVNQDHFEYLLADLERQQAWNMRIAETGAKGFAAMIPAVMLDLDNFVPGSIIRKGARLGRVGSIAAAGGFAGGTNAGIEAYLALNNPYRNAENVGFAAAGGIILGGGFGALAHGTNARLLRAADEAAKDVLRADVSHTLLQRYADGETEFTPEEWADIRLFDSSASAGESGGAALTVLGKSEETGDVDIIPGARKAVGELDEVETAPKFRWQALQKLQANIQGKLFGSLSQTMKDRSNRLIEGGFVADKKQARAFTAEGRAANITQTMRTRMFRETLADFNSWAKEKGVGRGKQVFGSEANEAFFTEVGSAMRGIDNANISPQAKAAAAKISKQMEEMHAMAKEAGLPGFDGDAIENFFPRNWQRQKMSEIFDKVDDETLGKWFAESLKRNLDEVPDEEMVKALDNLGVGFVTALKRQNRGMEDMLMHGIPADDVDRLTDLFRDLNVATDDMEVLIRRLTSANEGTSQAGVKHGKQRLRLDETFEFPVKTKPGKGDNGSDQMLLSLDKMTNTDAGKVIPRYFHVMGGAIGLAKEAGIKSPNDVKNLLKVMADEGATKAELTAFENSVDLISGRSIEEDVGGGFSQFSRVAMAYNYARLGGSFGVAQIPEMMNILAEVGVKNFFKHIPEFRNFAKRAANGEFENGLANELENLVAAGTDWINSGARSNFGDMGEEFTNDFLKGIDKTLQSAGRLTSALSLMAPINTFLERMATYDIAQNWAEIARKGSGSISEAKKARLRAAGLSDADQAKVFRQINKHAEFDDSGKMTALNIDKWKPDTADKYKLALDRQRRFVIQRNDIGNTGAYMHKPLGRLLTQFMSFMLNSINKQMLRNVHHNDIQTWVGFTTTTFLGGLAYTAQTSIDYANNPEERKERLSAEKIGTAAFQRSGWSSVIPTIIDTSLDLAGQDKRFSHSRQSGLGTSLITGNSTLQGIDAIARTATLPIRLLNDDYRFSQQDSRRASSLLLMQRTLGVKNALHAIDEGLDLPKSSKTSQ